MGRNLGKLGFDLDGVLYPWHELVLDDMIQMGYMPPESTVANLFNLPLGAFHRFSPSMRNDILKSPKYYTKPYLRAGVKKTLEALIKDWEIYYITSRPFEVASPTKAWVRGMGLPYRDNVYVVNGGKRATAELLDLDVFVDDRAGHVDELHDICAVILLTRPWNKEYNKDNHVRIDHLHELIPLLNGGLDDNHNWKKG